MLLIVSDSRSPLLIDRLFVWYFSGIRGIFPLLCRPPRLAVVTEPQKFFRHRGTAMAVITIPFDYDELTHPTIVPICIADTDSDGNAVHRGWIDLGVVPVVDRLFKIAESLLAGQIPSVRNHRVCGPFTVA